MKGLKLRSLVGCKKVSDFLLTSGVCKTKFFDKSPENDYKNKNNDCFVLKFSIESICIAYFPSSVFF